MIDLMQGEPLCYYPILDAFDQSHDQTDSLIPYFEIIELMEIDKNCHTREEKAKITNALILIIALHFNSVKNLF